MFELDNGEVITAADHAAGIIEGTGKTEYIGMTKVVSVRLPATLVAQIQGLAHKSARTRNATMAMLLEVGIEEVKARLTPETLEALADMTSEHYEDMIAEK
jgi:predicted DNA-binding protein